MMLRYQKQCGHCLPQAAPVTLQATFTAHRVTLWPGGLGERVEPRSLELQLPWGLRVVILRDDVLSLLLPSALSQCLWLLSVPSSCPGRLAVCVQAGQNGAVGDSGVGGGRWQTPSVQTRPVLSRGAGAIAPRYRKPSLLHLQDPSA